VSAEGGAFPGLILRCGIICSVEPTVCVIVGYIRSYILTQRSRRKLKFVKHLRLNQYTVDWTTKTITGKNGASKAFKVQTLTEPAASCSCCGLQRLAAQPPAAICYYVRYAAAVGLLRHWPYDAIAPVTAVQYSHSIKNERGPPARRPEEMTNGGPARDGRPGDEAACLYSHWAKIWLCLIILRVRFSISLYKSVNIGLTNENCFRRLMVVAYHWGISIEQLGLNVSQWHGATGTYLCEHKKYLDSKYWQIRLLDIKNAIQFRWSTAAASPLVDKGKQRRRWLKII